MPDATWASACSRKPLSFNGHLHYPTGRTVEGAKCLDTPSVVHRRLRGPFVRSLCNEMRTIFSIWESILGSPRFGKLPIFVLKSLFAQNASPWASNVGRRMAQHPQQEATTNVVLHALEVQVRTMLVIVHYKCFFLFGSFPK